MEIRWFGQSFFVVRAKKGKKVLRIAIDPYNEKIGLRLPRVETQVVLMTCGDCNSIASKADLKGNPFIVNEPGEYETEEVLIHGIRSFRDNKNGREKGINIIYKFKAEEIDVCHLGALGQEELSPEHVERIGEVDILMIPVGGTDTIDGKEAAEIVSQIGPKIVIPMHYQIPGSLVKLESVDKFLKNIGTEKASPLKTLEITSSEFSEEEKTEVAVLEPLR